MNKILLKNVEINKKAKKFSEDFVKDNIKTKYLFGRNVYANKIIEQIKVDGFIRIVNI